MLNFREDKQQEVSARHCRQQQLLQNYHIMSYYSSNSNNNNAQNDRLISTDSSCRISGQAQPYPAQPQRSLSAKASWERLNILAMPKERCPSFLPDKPSVYWLDYIVDPRPMMIRDKERLMQYYRRYHSTFPRLDKLAMPKDVCCCESSASSEVVEKEERLPAYRKIHSTPSLTTASSRRSSASSISVASSSSGRRPRQIGPILPRRPTTARMNGTGDSKSKSKTKRPCVKCHKIQVCTQHSSPPGKKNIFYRDTSPQSIRTVELEKDEDGRLGIRVRAMTDKIVICSVVDGTPGSSAGLRPGDQILQIDGVDVVGGAVCLIHNLFECKRPGQSFQIMVRSSMMSPAGGDQAHPQSFEPERRVTFMDQNRNVQGSVQ